jgi:thiol-disulfide isomerase/thioredoxin
MRVINHTTSRMLSIRAWVLYIFAGVLIFSILPAFASSPKRPPTLQQAVRLVDEEALEKVIAKQRGKVLLLNVWATWCEPCVREFPVLVRLHRKYAKQGLEVISVTVDSPETVRTAVRPFLARQRPGFPVFIKKTEDDEKFINRLDPEWSGAIPATFIYDRQGKKRFTHIGEPDVTVLESELKQLLAEPAKAPAATDQDRKTVPAGGSG